jgi:hypothetical protein
MNDRAQLDTCMVSQTVKGDLREALERCTKQLYPAAARGGRPGCGRQGHQACHRGDQKSTLLPITYIALFSHIHVSTRSHYAQTRRHRLCRTWFELRDSGGSAPSWLPLQSPASRLWLTGCRRIYCSHMYSLRQGGKGGGKLALAQGSAIFRNDNMQGNNWENFFGKWQMIICFGYDLNTCDIWIK